MGTAQMMTATPAITTTQPTQTTRITEMPQTTETTRWCPLSRLRIARGLVQTDGSAAHLSISVIGAREVNGLVPTTRLCIPSNPNLAITTTARQSTPGQINLHRVPGAPTLKANLPCLHGKPRRRTSLKTHRTAQKRGPEPIPLSQVQTRHDSGGGDVYRVPGGLCAMAGGARPSRPAGLQLASCTG